MKKVLLKNRRWIAFFLALLVIVTTCMNASDAFLWAARDGAETVPVQRENVSVQKIVEIKVEDESPVQKDSAEDAGEDADREGSAEDAGEAAGQKDSADDTGEDAGREDSAEDAGEAAGQKDSADDTGEDAGREDSAEDRSEDADGGSNGELKEYAYTICYYYDGVEDESARVEKTGAAGDVILASGDAPEEVIHNGENYILDRIENENAAVTEAEQNNVVKVCYRRLAANNLLRSNKASSADVYVYVEFAGVAADDKEMIQKLREEFNLQGEAKVGDDGIVWFTVGRIPDVSVRTPEFGMRRTEEELSAAADSLGKLERFQDNTIDLEMIKNWDLRVSLGATDYPVYENGAEVYPPRWHLDGHIDFSEMSYPYTVRYHYEKSAVDAETVTASGTGSAGDLIPFTDDIRVDYNGNTYTLEKTEGAGKTITENAGLNIVDVYYTLDNIGTGGENPNTPDDIPDKYQITFSYRAADSQNGTVTGILTEVRTVREIVRDADTGVIVSAGEVIRQNPGQPAAVNPEPGYRFTMWKDERGGQYLSDEALRNASFAENQTFEAYFSERNDLKYRVQYWYGDGIKGYVRGEAVSEDHAVYDSAIPYDAGQRREYDSKHYALEDIRFGNSDGKVSLDETANTVDIYYLLDENGPDMGPDGTADIEEYHVIYRANGGSDKMGLIERKSSEIYPEGYNVFINDGSLFTKADAVFAGWKHQNGTLYRAEDLKEDTVFRMENSDAVFTAQWQMLSISKDLAEDSKNRTFELKDRINFVIKVTNSGDVVLNDVTVTDTLTDAVIDTVDGESVPQKSNEIVISSMEPGSTAVLEAHYIVSESVIGNANFVNKVTVTNGTVSVEAETGKIPVGGVDKQLEINKTVTNLDEATGTDAEGNKVFASGDTAKFDITVRNAGNKSLFAITVEDELEGAKIVSGDGYIVHPWSEDKAIILYLAPDSDPVTVKAEYKIEEKDLGKTDFRNTAVASADGISAAGTTPDPIPVEEKRAEPGAVEEGYTLTIHYTYADGTTAFADYTGQYLAGETFTVYSPAIEGYNSSPAAVTGTMPASDMVITVLYSGSASTASTGGGGDRTPATPAQPEPQAVSEPEEILPVLVPAGAVQAVIPTQLTPIGDEEVPLKGALVEVDDDGNVMVTPINVEEIPLAGGRNNDHKCCMLHFLMMFSALLIYTWYVYSMRRHQKKLTKLKDELAEEMLKRRIGASDSRNAGR